MSESKHLRKNTFTEGKIFLPLLLFTLPIMASGLLQLLYNMADQAVVGQFSGDPNALAAVGSTSSLIHLILNMLLGISAGASVLVAQMTGAKNHERVHKAVHTAMLFAIVGGFVIAAVGYFATKPILTVMGTKEDILDAAALYSQVIFLGLPGAAVYNFGAAVLRSVGNSKAPLIILSLSGVINVLLNLLFVIGFDMSVVGVALATILSQYVSAVAVVVLLMRSDGPHRLFLRKLRIEAASLKRILIVGVPSALQGCLFSFSNVIIQSAVNTFPTTTVSGFTVANTLEGFAYTAMNSFHLSAITFVGQNYGANRYDRVRRCLGVALVQVTLVGILSAAIELVFAEPLMSLFVDMTHEEAPLIIAAGVKRLFLMLTTYFLCGIMEVLSAYLRGIGYSIAPMICCVFGVCGIRLFWTLVLFPLPFFNSEIGLFAVFPISWFIVVLLHAANCIHAEKHVLRKKKE